MADYNDYERLKMAHENCLEAIRTKDARIAELTAEVAKGKEDALLGQAFREIASRNYERSYASLFKAHVLEKFDIARNALKEGE